MIKGKVKIIAWPYGTGSIKPRFAIREEYPVVEVGQGAVAVLDDHNQVIWMSLDLLSFTEINGEKIPDLTEFLKANPEKSPEARAKATADAEAKKAQDALDEQNRLAAEQKKQQEEADKRAAAAAQQNKAAETTAPAPAAAEAPSGTDTPAPE